MKCISEKCCWHFQVLQWTHWKVRTENPSYRFDSNVPACFIIWWQWITLKNWGEENETMKVFHSLTHSFSCTFFTSRSVIKQREQSASAVITLNMSLAALTECGQAYLQLSRLLITLSSNPQCGGWCLGNF